MKQNPSLSVRTPEGCSLSRATSFNRYTVWNFIKNLKDLYQRYPTFADGTRVFNLDETSTSTVPDRLPKVVAQKGSKQISQATSGEHGVLVTTCCIISAGGTFLPPAMTFRRVHFKQHMISNAPTGTLGLATKTGWMNSKLFVDVMKHFINKSSSSKDNPALLILDNHESHLSIEVIDAAKGNRVVMLTVPLHTSNKLQPLDVGVFSSFNRTYYSALNSKLLHRKGTPLTIYDVAACVKIAHDRSMTPTNKRSAFKKCGIFPFDEDIFTAEDFMVSKVTDRVVEINRTTSDVNSLHHIKDAQSAEQASVGVSQSQDLQQAGPSAVLNTQTAFPNAVSPEIIRGYPKAENRKKNNKRKIG
ncbi:MFS-type transporter clz9-like [Schistocerca piceifrons]|uniref:MFS-type transporter clz9-like n=1 Tax=Schistocerca piceifrons TaxID=274613 RepID=UPI001F5F772E|nr:MFS-type transporter clz9-like [Schistocerca piceifrons]